MNAMIDRGGRMRKIVAGAVLAASVTGTLAAAPVGGFVAGVGAVSSASALTAPSRADRLAAGESLASGQQLVAPNGAVVLRMQSDGNLVAIASGNRPIWSTGTGGNAGAIATMQSDGNLVVIAPGNKPVWSSGTGGNPGAVTLMQNDGNVVVVAPGNVVKWASGSWAGSDTVISGAQLVPNTADPLQSEIRSADGKSRLAMQTDGNLVLYRAGVPVWSSGTFNNPGAVVRMQADGNLVVIAPGNLPKWASNTFNNPGAILRLQNDGNLVVIAPGNVAKWSSQTWISTQPVSNGRWPAYASDLLAKMGYTASANNMAAMLCWFNGEQPPTKPNGTFNPLNIQAGFSYPKTAGGQYNFPDWATGVNSTAAFMKFNDRAGYYKGIVDAFGRNAPPLETAKAIEASPWAAGHYGSVAGGGTGTVSTCVKRYVGDATYQQTLANGLIRAA